MNWHPEVFCIQVRACGRHRLSRSPRPGHLKSLVCPAEGSRAPAAVGGSCPIPSPPYTKARLVVTQMIFLTIFIKASFSSEQLFLAPRPTCIVLSTVPSSPLECASRSSGLRDLEDCVGQEFVSRAVLGP